MTAPIVMTAGARQKNLKGSSLNLVPTGTYLTPTTQFRKRSGQILFPASQDGLKDILRAINLIKE
ncbi:uncharacterized protein N7511_001712 [Penicillium nucicola]|uniref:uncharacterized protein n=1 Tax=Penicillium nucicola TaxID=1850975 RepID=UPI0025458EC9|nr:uncharacterized protein N7511_001712 [Penicillium nucicola]KAJ5776701.1 hypothetical protein N7511_001712 [Penicillium nucicola]